MSKADYKISARRQIANLNNSEVVMTAQENQTEETGSSWKMEDVIRYVKELMVYDEQIKILQEAKRDWSKEFIEECSIPKKELATALAMVKKNLDADAVDAMYEEIKVLVIGDED